MLLRVGKNLKLSPGAVKILPDVISQEEHDSIVDELLFNHTEDFSLKRFRRRKYERDHWDAAIVGFKEIERPLSQWSSGNRIVLERVRGIISQNSDPIQSWLEPHVIDLAKDGEILPHVDSIKFSGGLVCGLSLISSRVMCLQPPQESPENYAKGPDDMIQVQVDPRSLYILSKESRFDMAHSIAKCPENSRRMSIIFRDALSS